MNKKGSQVGLILSVVIFIGFLIFLYVIITPAIIVEDDENSIANSLDLALRNQFEAPLTVLTLSTDLPVTCWRIQDSSLGIGNNHFYIKDMDGNTLSASLFSNILYIGSNVESLKIYYSPEEFNYEEGGNCDDQENAFNIDSVKNSTQYFETKIINLIHLTNENYGDVKKLLEVPIDHEFGFGFVYENGTKIETSSDSNAENIYVSERSINYISKDAKLSSGILRIKTWS